MVIVRVTWYWFMMCLFNFLPTLSATYKTSYPTRRCAWVGRGASADETKNLLGQICWRTTMVPGLDSWHPIQWLCPLQGSVPEDPVRHSSHVLLREAIFVCLSREEYRSFIIHYCLKQPEILTCHKGSDKCIHMKQKFIILVALSTHAILVIEC